MVNSVRKAIEIVSLLSKGDGLGITEIANHLSIPKSSVHNILTTLQAERFVERSSESRKFHLGIRLIELGNQAQAELDIVKIAAPLLKQLNHESGETVHLTLLDNDEVLYVDCLESKKRLRTYSVIGVRAPLYCTSVGKAMLAFQSPEEVDRIVSTISLERKTANTITEPIALREELHAILHRGYAIDNMEHEEHLRCIGAPIFNANGTAFASISVSGPEQRISPGRIPEIAGHVVKTAREISTRSGCPPRRLDRERKIAG